MFFIDHTAKTTSFIDPRMPNDLSLLPSDLNPPQLLLPNDPNATLLPPPPPRNHGASLTPPPTARSSSPPTSTSHLAPPSSDVEINGRRRSRSVGDEDISRPSLAPSTLAQSQSNDAYALSYNERVIAFLRQPNVIDILKEKSSSILARKSLRDKINMIRQDGTQSLERLSGDVELIVLLR